MCVSMSAEPSESTAPIAGLPTAAVARPLRPGSVSWRDTFAALKHRNFRLFFIGQLVSLIGTWMQSTAQGWLVYQLTGSKILLGTVTACGTLPMLLLSLWGGSVADRHPKRTILYYTQTGMMLTAFVFAALVASGHIQTWQILLLAALGGVAMAFDMPARQSFMVEMTSHEDLMNAVSLNSSIVNGARVVGPAVAGILMASAGITWCFFLNGVSFIAVIAGLLLMRLPKFVPPQKLSSTGRHILEGFQYVAGHRQVRMLLLLFSVVGVFGWSYLVLLPAYAADILHVGERSYGVLLGANGFGALLGALTVATFGRRVQPRWMILGGLWLFSAMLLLLAFARWYPLVLLCLVVGGGGNVALFLHDEHLGPGQRLPCDARSGHGHLGAGVRRNDARRWDGIRLAVARHWGPLGRCGGSGDLCGCRSGRRVERTRQEG